MQQTTADGREMPAACAVHTGMERHKLLLQGPQLSASVQLAKLTLTPGIAAETPQMSSITLCSAFSPWALSMSNALSSVPAPMAFLQQGTGTSSIPKMLEA